MTQEVKRCRFCDEEFAIQTGGGGMHADCIGVALREVRAVLAEKTFKLAERSHLHAIAMRAGDLWPAVYQLQVIAADDCTSPKRIEENAETIRLVADALRDLLVDIGARFGCETCEDTGRVPVGTRASGDTIIQTCPDCGGADGNIERPGPFWPERGRI